MAFTKPNNTDYDSSGAPRARYIGAYTTLMPSNGYEWRGGASGIAQSKYFCKENPTDKTVEGSWVFENGANAVKKSLFFIKTITILLLFFFFGFFLYQLFPLKILAKI